MTRARRDQRWREQAARLIAEAMKEPHEQHLNITTLARWMAETPGMADGFDAARVRAYCERVIAEADDLDEQREVFADWTRARGKGPECRDPGAFIRERYYSTVDWREIKGKPEWDPRGGWPGKLAREYVAEQASRRRCPREDCDGGWITIDECVDCAGHRYTSEIGCTEVPGPGPADERISCESCSGRGQVRHACPECEMAKHARPSRAFVNGGNLRRAAQRLLDTLDGRCPWNAAAEPQSSECLVCSRISAAVQIPAGRTVATADGGRLTVVPGSRIGLVTSPDVVVCGIDGRQRNAVVGEAVLLPCRDCNGTGHNLRGVLPPLPQKTLHRLRRDPDRAYGEDIAY